QDAGADRSDAGSSTGPAGQAGAVSAPNDAGSETAHRSSGGCSAVHSTDGPGPCVAVAFALGLFAFARRRRS
ncbi:MAG TPA: MYXO-CTERM sorting domain-containing protein, partial [Polyangiales bacterium]